MDGNNPPEKERRNWHKKGMNAIKVAIIHKDELKLLSAVDDRYLGALSVLEVELYNTRLAIRQSWSMYNDALDLIKSMEKQALLANNSIKKWEERHAYLWNQVRDEKFKELQRGKYEQEGEEPTQEREVPTVEREEPAE